jgi:membrane associated rhomboid family serine protease
VTENSSEHDSARPEAPSEPTGKREPVFNLPGIVTAIIAACVAIHLFRVLVLSSEEDFALLLRAAFIPLRYSGAFAIDVYALLSPLTYAFLHGDMLHLGVNMIWLAAFGSPLVNRLGNVRFLIFWAATAIAAAAAHGLLHPADPVPLVGASGAISGMMGAAARYGFRVDRSNPRAAFRGPLLSIRAALATRMVLAFLAIWIVANLVAGFGYLSPDIAGPVAWEAHIGGFLAGFLAIPLFDQRNQD